MKNNEYLSVKQFSERAGVSSQAVYKQLNNKLKKFKKVENGKTYVNIRGLSCFVSTNSTNVVQPVEQLSTNVEQPVEQMIELLKEQLKAKDEQIRALNEQLKAKDETLKNAMRITENTQILLKNKQEKSMPAIKEKKKEQQGAFCTQEERRHCMPNHVMNIVRFSGDGDAIRRMREAIQNPEYGIGSIDFNRIIPMPPSLDMEESSCTRAGLRAYRN